MRIWKIAAFCLATLVLIAGLFEGLRFVLFHKILEHEAQVRERTAAQKAGQDLSVLCQTCRVHPEWFSDEPPFAPAWTPKSVLDLNPTWVEVTSNGARVEFGGGFHHFGYLMAQASQVPLSDETDRWTLTYYSEDSENRELGRFGVALRNVLTKQEFVERTMAEFDRRIAVGNRWSYDDASEQRCKFAIKHGEIPRLQSAIRNSARRHSDAWRDVLFAFVLDYPADRPGAIARLRQWASAKGDFSAWLVAAYGLHKVGEVDASEEAVSLACKLPADDPPWSRWHARFRAYPMCRNLFLAGKYETCAKLCESLLAYKGGGDNMISGFANLRNECQLARSQSIANPPPLDKSEFDPFAGLDISVLRGANRPEPKAAKP